jgi:hypothetical protein
MAQTNRPEGLSGGGRGPGGYSYRSSELTAAERRALVKQNKSAESLMNKDLDKLEKNKALYKAQKAAKAKKILQDKKAAVGKAGILGVAVGAAAQMAIEKAKAKVKAKPTPKAKPKKPTKSEQNFLDGQKLKKKMLKKTGVYKNTAT